MQKIHNKAILLLMVLGFITITATAQKPPNVQEVSLRAPGNIKTDGKATEWNDQLQAYNKATNLFYTLSNDDNNLYLTIQATDQAVIKRIVNGGITLVINRSGKKNKEGAVTITYPIFEKNNRFTAIFHRRDDPASTTWYDSIMNVNNTRLSAKAKMIRVTGMPDIDTLVSVYNADGIKANALFNNKLVYTYELAVSLKPLGLHVNNPSKFTYQVKINEVAQYGITITGKDGSSITDMNTDPSLIGSINIAKDSQIGQYATDFWAEYTLAK